MFGVRDESLHAARRKTVAFSFSSTSIAGMESFVHNYIAKLVSILDGFADSGKTIYLDRWISFCITDILGELAFSRSFEALKYGEDNMPTIPKHVSHILFRAARGKAITREIAIAHIIHAIGPNAEYNPLCEQNYEVYSSSPSPNFGSGKGEIERGIDPFHESPITVSPDGRFSSWLSSL